MNVSGEQYCNCQEARFLPHFPPEVLGSLVSVLSEPTFIMDLV